MKNKGYLLYNLKLIIYKFKRTDMLKMSKKSSKVEPNKL